jgi:hypothetical protein
MNRFVIGGILAAIVMLLTGSLNRLFADRNQSADLPNLRQTDSAPSTAVSDLGSLPVEQAGKLVRRQSDLSAGGVSATSDSVFNDSGTGAMAPGGRAIIAPANTGIVGTQGTVNPAPGNVIPRTGGAATFPTTTGDIAPIDPRLVQPGAGQRPVDPDLDSIPALW